MLALALSSYWELSTCLPSPPSPSTIQPLFLLRLFVCFSDETLFALPATSAPLMHSSAGKFFLLTFVWIHPAFLISLTLSDYSSFTKSQRGSKNSFSHFQFWIFNWSIQDFNGRSFLYALNCFINTLQPSVNSWTLDVREKLVLLTG